MAGPIEVQLRNAQSAVLFMQQEHAKTLQGLHAELQKLQKKCAELTFELAMKSEDVDEEQYREKQRELGSQLDEREGEIRELNAQVEDGDRRLSSLEQDLKLQEKKLVTETKQHEQKLASLEKELDKKSANIAYLTNQLRQMALARHKVKEHSSDAINRVPSTTPQPPQKPVPSHRRRVRTPSLESVSVLKNGRITTTASALSDSYDNSTVFDYPSRHNRRLSSPASTSRSYDDRDVAAFVAKVDTATSDIEIKPAPPILPPISPFPQGRRSSNGSPYYSRRALRVTKPPDPEHTEINSLVVQTVHSRKKDLHATQRSNGDRP